MTATEATAWHSLTREEALERLKSSATAGLDDADASRRPQIRRQSLAHVPHSVAR